ncbi:MAG TPA: M1 family metallopeptidase [Polyangiaceae bacterium]|nr:M1 family metallopeptidase [Polyangiaceae bacterium]
MGPPAPAPRDRRAAARPAVGRALAYALPIALACLLPAAFAAARRAQAPGDASGAAGSGPAYVFRARFGDAPAAPPPASPPPALPRLAPSAPAPPGSAASAASAAAPPGSAASAPASSAPASSAPPPPSPAAPGPPGDAAPRAWHATTLRAVLDPAAHVVAGEEEIVWTNHSVRSTDELYWHLYLNAFRDTRSLFLRESLGPGRGGRPPDDAGRVDVERIDLFAVDAEGRPAGEPVDLWGPAEKHTPGDPEDATDLRVALPRPVPPGGRIALRVRFRAKLPSIVERTGYSGTFHMVAQWFPKLAQRTPEGTWNHFPFHRLAEFAADFGSYDATLDVPEGYLVGATGRLVEERREGGRVLARYAQDRVHDFAWVAATGLLERRERVAGADVRLLYPPGHERALAREIDALAGAFDCFGRRYGPYPYDVLTVVHPPPGAEEAGGMEYPTLVTTGGPWHGPPLARSIEAVTVHEFGHQYFYGLVASDEHAAPFLDEGLTSYAEGACLDERYGPGSGLESPWLRVESAALMRPGAVESGRDVPLASPATGFPSARHYGTVVYERGALLLRTLAGAFGADVVDGALGRYAREQRFRHPGPAELLAAFGEAGGPDLREALRAGLFERGWLDVAVTDLSSRPGEGPRGTRSRAVVVRRGNLALPLRVRFFFDDGTVEDRAWAGQGTFAAWDIDGPSALRAVVADPEGALWLDENWANNARSLEPQTNAPRVWERAAYWLGLLGVALAP